MRACDEIAEIAVTVFKMCICGVLLSTTAQKQIKKKTHTSIRLQHVVHLHMLNIIHKIRCVNIILYMWSEESVTSVSEWVKRVPKTTDTTTTTTTPSECRTFLARELKRLHHTPAEQGVILGSQIKATTQQPTKKGTLSSPQNEYEWILDEKCKPLAAQRSQINKYKKKTLLARSFFGWPPRVGVVSGDWRARRFYLCAFAPICCLYRCVLRLAFERSRSYRKWSRGQRLRRSPPPHHHIFVAHKNRVICKRFYNATTDC